MVFLNYTTLQMTAKIVYYGPGLCGKTTNLQWIHGKTAPSSRGEMISLETETDRTLFFDLLPLDVGVIGGMKVRLQLYTVPGQVFYNATRRLVLKGVDGVVFVADSQVPALEPNEESLANLKQNLEELGLAVADVPIVFQYNKRDLRNILPVEKLETGLNPMGAPSFEAAAIHGVGVFETLKEISRLALNSVRSRIAEERATPAAEPGEAPPPAAAEAESPPAAAAVTEPASAGDPLLMEPLAVEFAEEDTDKVKLRAVSTKGSLDIGEELRKLRAMTRDTRTRAPTAVRDRKRDGDTPTTRPEARQEIQRKTALEVPPHLLKGLTDLRIHLGFDRDGREEILRDAVRLTLVGTRRLEKLSVRLDLDLQSKD
jgi:signal recognition particle receptor subunit beta